MLLRQRKSIQVNKMVLDNCEMEGVDIGGVVADGGDVLPLSV
jgi:hypothetical protein